MDEIVAQVKRVTDIIAEISAAPARADAAASARSTRPSAQLDQVTQQNAALVEEAAAAADSLQAAGRAAWRRSVGVFKLDADRGESVAMAAAAAH